MAEQQQQQQEQHDVLDCALDLMRRLPPQDIPANLERLIGVLPELSEELLSSVDQPLTSKVCPATGKEFLLCDYNRDANSYRSPWSNEYDPPLEDGTKPSEALRQLEVLANDAFDTYRDLYFDGGVSSVYMWDLDEGFAAVVLIKKKDTQGHHGSWNSIHVVQVIPAPGGRSAHYQLTSTILLELITQNPSLGQMDLAGNLTRQAEQDFPLEDFQAHVANMGRLIEDMETKMRNAIQDIYFGKTKDIVNDLRSITDLIEAKKQEAIKSELAAKLSLRKKT